MYDFHTQSFSLSVRVVICICITSMLNILVSGQQLGVSAFHCSNLGEADVFILRFDSKVS